jgi:hypothetical protein
LVEQAVLYFDLMLGEICRAKGLIIYGNCFAESYRFATKGYWVL